MRREVCYIYDDILYRHFFLKCEYYSFFLKGVLGNQYVNIITRNRNKYNLYRFIRHNSYIKQRDKCRLTGNSSFVLRHVKLHRLFGKFYIGSGFFRGLNRMGGN